MAVVAPFCVTTPLCSTPTRKFVVLSVPPVQFIAPSRPTSTDETIRAAPINTLVADLLPLKVTVPLLRT